MSDIDQDPPEGWDKIQRKAHVLFGLPPADAAAPGTAGTPSRLHPSSRPATALKSNAFSPKPALAASGPVTEAAPACADCDGTGWFVYAVPLEDPRFGQPQRCGCVAPVDAAKVAARQQQQLDALASELGAMADCTFASFDTERELNNPTANPKDVFTWRGQEFSPEFQRLMLRRAKAEAAAFAVGATGWCYLHGAFGSGKSHLAAAIGHELAAIGRTVLYRSVPALLDALRSGYRDGSYDARMAAVCTVDVLILDDLGAEHLSDSAEGLLFTLLNERDRHDRVTVLTANVDPEDVPGRLGSRILGHLRARIWLPVSDLRKLRFAALRATQRVGGGQ